MAKYQAPANNFRVSLHEQTKDGFVQFFDCFADDAEQAFEQAENAYPHAELLVATRLN